MSLPSEKDINLHLDALLYLTGYKRGGEEAGLKDDSPSRYKIPRTQFPDEESARDALMSDEDFGILPEDMIVVILSHRDIIDVVKLRAVSTHFRRLIDERVLVHWSQLLLPFPLDDDDNHSTLRMYQFAISKMRVLERVCLVVTTEFKRDIPWDYFEAVRDDGMGSVKELDIFLTRSKAPFAQIPGDKVLKYFPNLTSIRSNVSVVLSLDLIESSSLEVIDLMPDDWPLTTMYFLRGLSDPSQRWYEGDFRPDGFAGEVKALVIPPDYPKICKRLRVFRALDVNPFDLTFARVFPQVTSAIVHVKWGAPFLDFTINPRIVDLLVIDQERNNVSLVIPESMAAVLERFGYIGSPSKVSETNIYVPITKHEMPVLRHLQIQRYPFQTDDDEPHSYYLERFLHEIMETMPSLQRLELYDSPEESMNNPVKLTLSEAFLGLEELRIFISHFEIIDNTETGAFPAVQCVETTSPDLSYPTWSFPKLKNLDVLCDIDAMIDTRPHARYRYWGFPAFADLYWFVEGDDVDYDFSKAVEDYDDDPPFSLRQIMFAQAATFARMWYRKTRSQSLDALMLTRGLEWAAPDHTIFDNRYLLYDAGRKLNREYSLSIILKESDICESYQLTMKDATGVGIVIRDQLSAYLNDIPLVAILETFDTRTGIYSINPEIIPHVIALIENLRVEIKFDPDGPLHTQEMSSEEAQHEISNLLSARSISKMEMDAGVFPFVFTKPLVDPGRIRTIEQISSPLHQAIQVSWNEGDPKLGFVIDKWEFHHGPYRPARLPPLKAFTRVDAVSLFLRYAEAREMIQVRGISKLIEDTTIEHLALYVKIDERLQGDSDELEPTVPQDALPKTLKYLKLAGCVMSVDYLMQQSLPHLVSLRLRNCHFLDTYYHPRGGLELKLTHLPSLKHIVFK